MRTRLVPGLAILVLLGIVLSACAPSAPPPAAAPTPISTAAKASAPAPTAAAKPSPTPAPPTPTPKPEKVVMAIPAAGTTADIPTVVGIEKGFWRQEGLEVDKQVLSSDITTKAVIAGEIEFSRAIGSAVRAAVQGLPIKGILASDYQPPYFLVARPEFNSIAELKGKAIGVNAIQGTTHLILKDILKAKGMDPEKDVVAMPIAASPTRLQSVVGGANQATMLDVVFAIRAEKQGLRILAGPKDFSPRMFNGIATSDKRIKENPDQVLRFVRGYVRSLKYVADPKNKQEIIQLIGKEMQLSSEEAVRVYEVGGAAELISDGDMPENLVKLEIEDAKAEAQITKDIPVSQVFDYSFVKKLKQ